MTVQSRLNMVANSQIDEINTRHSELNINKLRLEIKIKKPETFFYLIRIINKNQTTCSTFLLLREAISE